MSAEDFGVVVGIRYYPKLPGHTLFGPVNDATDFRDWLVRSDGGDIPPHQVILITSTGPEDPLPDGDAIMDTINDRILAAPHEQKRAAAGRRLYLYFAGHGFSPAPGTDCLLVARATEQSGANLAISAYATYFLAWFREVVVIGDFCRTRFTGWEARTTFGHPVRKMGGGKTTFVRWFASEDGMESREAPPGDPAARGRFTRTLLAGLDAVRKDGAVTVTRLNRWMTDNAPVDPLTKKRIKFPSPMNNDPDFVLCEAAPKDGSCPGVAVRLTLNHLPAGTGFSVQDFPGTELGHGETPGLLALTLNPGFYKVVVAGQANKPFEVPLGSGGVVDVNL